MFLSFLLKAILLQIDLSSKDESSFQVFGNRISGWCSVDVWRENGTNLLSSFLRAEQSLASCLTEFAVQQLVNETGKWF
jgi:hypothetical protein